VYEVTVDAEGFAPWSGVLRARDGEPASLRATPVALPPPSGDVTVTASTRGAVVLLDGEVRGFAPTVLSAVPAGRHRLEVRASDTLPWAGEVEVQRDRRSWVTVSLESEGEQVERSPATWITGAIGLAGLASAGVTGFLTAGLHDRYYQGGYDTGDPALAARGRDLALATDLLAVGGSVLLATGIVLFFATETRTARVSRASVSEDAP
jgi:hypothetical protein